MKKLLPALITAFLLMYVSVEAQQKKKDLTIPQTANEMLSRKLITEQQKVVIDSMFVALSDARKELAAQKGAMTETGYNDAMRIVSDRFTNDLRDLLGTKKVRKWGAIRFHREE